MSNDPTTNLPVLSSIHTSDVASTTTAAAAAAEVVITNTSTTIVDDNKVWSDTKQEGNNDKDHESNNDNNDDIDDDWQVQRDNAKQAGDRAFRLGHWDDAIQQYSLGLSLDPTHGALLSNRSAAYLHNKQKSLALHDAVACVATNSMGRKGISRHAAALQALGRYEMAFKMWQDILQQDCNHAAAQAGKSVCEAMMKQQQCSSTTEEITGKEVEKNIATTEADEEDELGDFFNEVEEAAELVVKEKLLVTEPVATEAIKTHKKDLGTTEAQIERLLPENYVWYNLNPFHVLDLPHTATEEDISRRYKALSLLLHPDKNRSLEKAQLAYDQVLTAKAILFDPDKCLHVRQLCEQGMVRGRHDYDQQRKNNTIKQLLSLEECQRVAIQRLFAEIEHTRRQVKKREMSFQHREQQQEDAAATQQSKERQFDKRWREDDRVDQRIGSWRSFQKKPKKC